MSQIRRKKISSNKNKGKGSKLHDDSKKFLFSKEISYFNLVMKNTVY